MYLQRFRSLALFLGVTALATEAWSAPAVTFDKDIAPIVYQNCSPCHRPGESGPFPLLSYDDVKKRAPQIAEVTKRKYMPPWLPEAGYGEFTEERRLTPAQIQLIQDWVQAGAPAGSTSRAVKPPAYTSEWTLGKPDLILHISKPYQLAADGPEDLFEVLARTALVDAHPASGVRTRW